MPAAASEPDEPPQRPISSSFRGIGPGEPPPFAELHCRSNFTFLVGASQPEELVRRAAAKFYTALALTDECTLSGVVRAHLEARECGLHFIVGSEIHFTTASGAPFMRLVLLAQDRRGYGNLSELITIARRRAEKGSYIAHVGDIEGKVSRAPHLAGMPGCIALLLPYRSGTLESIFAQCMWLKTWFPDRAWVAGPNAFEIDEDLHCWYIEEAAARAGLKIVATTDTIMHAKGRKRLQDVVTAIRLNTPVQDCGFNLRPNAEQYLRARNVLAEDFPHVWLRETLEVARRCTFSLEELRYEYPEEIVPLGETAASHLRKLTYAGAAGRFPQGLPDKVRAQIEHELTIIGQLQYEAYFLTVEDIVRFARKQNILCQGRGSAANSAVCYCLGVTEVDPARMSVLFVAGHSYCALIQSYCSELTKVRELCGDATLPGCFAHSWMNPGAPAPRPVREGHRVVQWREAGHCGQRGSERGAALPRFQFLPYPSRPREGLLNAHGFSMPNQGSPGFRLPCTTRQTSATRAWPRPRD